MWIYSLLLLFAISLSAQEPSTVLPANYDHEQDVDSEELSEIALSMYFDGESPEVYNAVYPRVKSELKDVNRIPEVLRIEIINELTKLKQSTNHRHSYRSYHHHYPHIHGYISKIVHRCMREALYDSQQNYLEADHDKQCYKIAALTLGFVGTVLTVGSALIVHFTEGSCEKT